MEKANKIFVNRIVDCEEPYNNEYTYMYVTKKECSELIEDCVNFYYNYMYEEENANNLEYLLQEYNIQNEQLIEYLNKNLNEIDTDNGVITFVENVLQYLDLLLAFEETEIKY